MRHKQAWTIPADEARTLLQQIQRKIASSDIEVAHRDVLIRLRSIIEEDLEVEGERRRLSLLGRRQRGTTTRAGISDVQVVLAGLG
jgi:hypothetical protein